MAGINCFEGVEVLLLFQTVLYCLLFIIVTVVTVCIGTLSAHMNNVCLISASLTWNDTLKSFSEISPGSTCEFIIYTHVIEIIYTALFAAYHVYMFCKSRNASIAHGSLIARPAVVFNFIFSTLTLIMASIISAGLHYVCSQANDHVGGCRELQSQSSWKLAQNLTVSDSITDMEVAQGFIWIGFFFWVGILALSIIRHLKNQRGDKTQKYAASLIESSGAEMTGYGEDKDETVLFDGFRPSHST